jgi:cytoskeletal protein RodZ
MYSSNKPLRSSRPKAWRRPVPVAIGVILLAVVILGVLELTNTTYLLHDKQAVSSTIPADSPDSDSSSDDSSSGDPNTTTNTATSPATPPTASKTPGTTPNSGPPQTPSGNFVSNHQPSLGNKDGSSSALESVCVTSVGATCKIIFTRDGVTKTLEEKKVGSDGFALWTWDINQAGFVEGTWEITAISTLNGVTSTSKDPLNMEVKP